MLFRPPSCCQTGTACEAVIEPFLIPLLDTDAFQLREPRSRTASTQHTHLEELMVASFPPSPARSLSGHCGLWAFGLHVVVIHMIYPTRCIIDRMAGGDQSQGNVRRGPRILSICTQTENHEDSLSVSTKRVM